MVGPRREIRAERCVVKTGGMRIGPSVYAIYAYPGGKEETKKSAEKKDGRVETCGRNICQCCTPLVRLRREVGREKERERAKEGKKRTIVIYTQTVCTRTLHVRYRAFQRGPLKYGIRWTKRDPLTLSLSLSLSVPRDLLITLESECSLALRFRPEGERAKHRVCSAASGEQSAAASTGCDIYRASGSPAIFPRQSVTSMGN